MAVDTEEEVAEAVVVGVVVDLPARTQLPWAMAVAGNTIGIVSKKTLAISEGNPETSSAAYTLDFFYDLMGPVYARRPMYGLGCCMAGHGVEQSFLLDFFVYEGVIRIQ